MFTFNLFTASQTHNLMEKQRAERQRGDGGREGREGERERGREGERESGREGEWERGREGERERGREGERERGREGETGRGNHGNFPVVISANGCLQFLPLNRNSTVVCHDRYINLVV